ncbi:acylphosphatase-1-like [Ornithodoros turicata]|uniref:acylphosphatase-1-like n=1 Tax=Ornithodoros turicata TaxID=34597 RepID=UPI00313A4083
MLVSTNFEVYGRVQGVFFRKCTKQKADELGVKGWCRNTSEGTVEGVIQGPKVKIDTMKDWLRNEGSPASQIKGCLFQDEREISAPEFGNFQVRR